MPRPQDRGDRVPLLEPTAVLVRGALRAAALLEAVAIRQRLEARRDLSRRGRRG
jgi:hypothetical protein